MESLTTKVKALQEATKLLQLYGFNGFSFQTVAEKLGIKKQSLYVHFKSKEELGTNLIESYSSQFKSWTKTIEGFDPLEQITALFDLFHKFNCENRRYCPTSALAADFNSLPKKMQTALTASLEFQRGWIEKLLKEAQKKNLVRKDIKASSLAQHVMATAFGGQLLGRTFLDPSQINELKKSTIEFLSKV